VNRNGKKPRRPYFGLLPGETFEDYYCRFETYFRGTQTESQRIGYVAEFYDLTRETIRMWVAQGLNIYRIDQTHEFATFKRSRRRSNRDETKRHRLPPRPMY
jgi:hypothetical protein